jgi:GT2 family glycosyltransferase
MLFNQELASNVLNALDTAKEAAIELNNALRAEDGQNAGLISSDLRILLQSLQSVGNTQCGKNPEIKLGSQMECASDSLERVISLAAGSFNRAQHKLEFELFPMFQDIYAQFYYWACVYPDAKRMRNYRDNEVSQLYGNSYIAEALESGEYKYEATIVVLAYNHLDYTKQCCESLLANLPQGLNYELILINHGSSDGTKAYFVSLNPHKQFDIRINDCGLLQSYVRIVEGKYILFISNDTIITHNAVGNMLRAMREDRKIAKLVPATPNISNLQVIPATYGNIQEMKQFAKKNNRYDPNRHEMRTRLCDPIACMRSDFNFNAQTLCYAKHCMMGTSDFYSFPDDMFGMLVRRLGYKNILAKDAYCYHFGHVTINSEAREKQIDLNAVYRNGRIVFEKLFGIDPWGTGFCYDPVILSIVKCEFSDHIEVLGVNCGHGSNSLKVKELYKELKHNLDVTLTNVTSDTRYIEDLRGVSDSARTVMTIDEIFENGKLYHHIVVDDSFYGSVHNLDDLERIFAHLVADGAMYVNYGAERESILKYRFPDAQFTGNWAVLKNKSEVSR